jgi:uncharacterized protein YeaO (DUF488 family)
VPNAAVADRAMAVDSAAGARSRAAFDEKGAALMVRVKCAYDASTTSDGRRVLVDRAWPRGLSKDELRLDEWIKEIAPSAALRRWFGHDPAKFEAFKRRYFRELDQKPEKVQQLSERARIGTVTLVYGTKDEHHNNAVALEEYIEDRFE